MLGLIGYLLRFMMMKLLSLFSPLVIAGKFINGTNTPLNKKFLSCLFLTGSQRCGTMNKRRSRELWFQVSLAPSAELATTPLRFSQEWRSHNSKTFYSRVNKRPTESFVSCSRGRRLRKSLRRLHKIKEEKKQFFSYIWEKF